MRWHFFNDEISTSNEFLFETIIQLWIHFFNMFDTISFDNSVFYFLMRGQTVIQRSNLLRYRLKWISWIRKHLIDIEWIIRVSSKIVHRSLSHHSSCGFTCINTGNNCVYPRVLVRTQNNGSIVGSFSWYMKWWLILGWVDIMSLVDQSFIVFRFSFLLWEVGIEVSLNL